MATLDRHTSTPTNYDLDLPGRGTLQDKAYIGFVKVADDVLRMGRLKVWIPELSGDPTDESGWFIVNYCSPFAGATNVYDNRNENTYTGTQKSYGMWFIPPDINNEVLCMFINGDPARGIWLGCMFQQNMNHMVPGIPGQETTPSTPVAEYNKRVNNANLNSPTRPIYEPLAEGLLKQGLNEDIIRGVSDSGARRDEPANSVYGILTPGGSQFVFDDSPSNAYIRLRTQSGAQIMINDTSGFIYLNSVDGKNWISMDATGKIDIYAQDDISIRSQGSVNIRGDLDVNIEAGRDINMRARGRQAGAGVTTNPASSAPPPAPPIGNIVVIGDGIALSTGNRIDGVIIAATVNDNSTEIAGKIQTNTGVRNAVNAILSVGTHDVVNEQVNTSILTQNLTTIRTSLAATNYIWLLPYNSLVKAAVSDFATTNNDKTLDLSRYPTSDNVYPRDYPLVANDLQALCIPAPGTVPVAAASSPTGPQNTGTTVGTFTYTTGYYRTLPEAEAGAARYRAAADFARANPNMYSPAEATAVFRFEAASNAEVQRLRGAGATTPTTVQAAQVGPTGPVAAGATQQPSTTGATGIDWRTIASPFIKREEGIRGGQPTLRAYRDPPREQNAYAIGYGHNISRNELSANSRNRSSINAGSAGSVAIVGTYGENTVCTAEQAEGIFQVDLDNIGGRSVRNVIRGAWDLIGPYQRAALASFAYNAGQGGIQELANGGLTNFINQRDIESAAQLISRTRTRARDGTDLTRRRTNEANLYRERAELAGTGSNGTDIDGYPRTANDVRANAQGMPISPNDDTIQGGFIKIQSKNSMHLLSEQHLFISGSKDIHRLAGQNILDTAVQNINRVAGGYMHESVRADWAVTSGRSVNINAPRIDMNGAAPPAATPAAQAIGPTSQRQTDATINTLGNVVAILTDTIMPHLPFHEPYDNHGGRNFENIRDATSINQNTGLRDGEIVVNSAAPLDIYGTPRSDMPSAVYRGVDYNSRNQPLYRYESPMTNITNVMVGTSLVISEAGKQFITARENGSYRTITIGNPPKQEIGYGHSLTPDEIANRRIVIKGLSVTLQDPLTQQQINDLFDEDIEKVQNWMRPEIKMGVSQTQYDMFCSLAFNIGENNFKSSNALKAFNEGNMQRVPNTWMEHTVNGAGQVVPGLIVRRRAEIVKFMQGPATDYPAGESNVAVDTTQF